MTHPFDRLTPSQRKGLFWSSLAATILLMLVMNLVGAPLVTDPAPYGIVSFELAGNPAQAGAILDSWNQEDRLHAAFSLGLDYLFMVVYSTSIGLACLWTRDVLHKRGWPLARFGAPLAWGQWAAASLDALENVALTVVLLASLGSPWPELAKWCALIKFLLIFLGLIYAFYGLIVFLITRRSAYT